VDELDKYTDAAVGGLDSKPVLSIYERVIVE